MSYLGWKPPRAARSPWHLFPWALIAGLGVVVAVNAGMVFAALHTFPGQTGDEGYELSNHYDAVLDRAQQQALLGWDLSASAGDGRAMVTLRDRTGMAIAGATIIATAARPLGAIDTQRLVFHETAAGHYAADASLPLPGQWELTIAASANGHNIAATRRIIVH
jgi:nitrogen fixation protein FixH